MWSLYRKKTSEEDSGIFNYSGELMAPLKFSNGKDQEDIVKEVMEAIKDGHKMIFIKGVCGSGKSAMALNLAKNFKKTSIVVPIKSLQAQYEEDYTRKMFITKDDGNPLKISVIKGRNNFPCKYGGDRADDPEIPCIIEIKEKNTDKLLRYIEENPLTQREDFSAATDVKRMNVAPACPYWSPIMPADIEPRGIKDYKKLKYDAISGVEFALFQRKKGCPYYDQYTAYADADVLIFNSMKYQIETTLGRKPKTDLDIIDECDEFLDNFANERRLNLTRLASALNNLLPKDQEKRTVVKELIHEVNNILFNPPVIDVQKLRLSPFIGIIEKIIANPNLAEEEELNYYTNAVEIARSFESLIDETYVSVEDTSKFKSDKQPKQNSLFGDNFSQKQEDQLFISLVSINLVQKLKELIEQNNVMVLMSGTLHSPEVLKDIFGIEKFIVIEAEAVNPGTIKIERTGLERNCSYANFQNGTITRDMYLKIMDLCLANSKKPTLVHVSAFKDLPTEEENARLKFDNLITSEKLKELQLYSNQSVDEFKNKQSEVLFTTKCARGADFAGDICNSIVITKFPYPNIQGLFWKILKQEQPEKFMEFYMDRARRDLKQKVARGVRFKGDKVSLWSPDVRVLNARFD